MNIYTDDKFTVTETFQASRKKSNLSPTFTVEQRYHGKQIISYRLVETGQVMTSEGFWGLGFKRVK